MKKSEILSRSYEFYCNLEGNQHIASEFAIKRIQELIDHFEIKRVLEVGLGIGAIAGSLLTANEDLSYSGTENNDFCLKALKRNLKKDYKRLNLISNINDLDPEVRFDLLIIDGKDVALQQLSPFISSKGIIVIEGDRKEQQVELQNIFPGHSYVHSISKNKNKEYSPFPSNHWQGGIKIIFKNPDFKQKLWWSREKFKTKIKYFLRT